MFPIAPASEIQRWPLVLLLLLLLSRVRAAGSQACVLVLSSLPLIVAPLALFANGPAARADQRPNVLFIAVDDLNDWVGCLSGHPQTKTPNIDRLAARGMLFTNAHCAAPLCNPSRTAVMTGLLPSTSGVHGNEQDWHDSPYLDGHLTLPRWFQEHGYHTMACGKLFHANHGGEVGALNGGHGGLQGFDDFPAWNERFPASDRQLVRDALLPGQNLNSLDIWHWDWGPMDAADNETTDGRAVTWAEEKLGKSYEKPFFLAVGVYRPHGPWYVPKKYFNEQPALADIELPEVRDDDLEDVPAVAKRYVGRPNDLHALLTKRGLWDDAVQAYLANIAFADAMAGRVLEALDASPHRDNTVVVLWSDHGWHLGEKQRWHKSTLWEEATRVPLIVAAPDVTEPGSRCERAVSLVDLYPTLCELCELPVPEQLDGTSVVPLLREPGKAGHPPAITVLGGRHRSVRTDRWRFNRYGDGSEELYDHASDPNEWTNLAGEPQYQDLKAELVGHLPSEIRTYEEDHGFPNEPGFRPIFNGYDLTGWQAPGGFWTIQDGSIVGQHRGLAAVPRPLAWTGSRLNDFELRLRFRVSDGAKITIRSTSKRGNFTTWSQAEPDAWTELVLVHRDGVVTATYGGSAKSFHAGANRGLRELMILPPERGRIELTDIRLRDLGGR